MPATAETLVVNNNTAGLKLIWLARGISPSGIKVWNAATPQPATKNLVRPAKNKTANPQSTIDEQHASGLHPVRLESLLLCFAPQLWIAGDSQCWRKLLTVQKRPRSTTRLAE